MDEFEDLQLDDILNEIDESSKREEEKNRKSLEEEKAKNELINNDLDKKLDELVSKDILEVKVDESLTQKQYSVIDCLVRGVPKAQIYATTGVPVSTINRWLKTNEKFITTLEETQKEYLVSFQRQVMSNIPKAINSLVEVLDDYNAPYRDKINASKTILEYSNIKNGGIKMKDSDAININQPQILILNPNPTIQKAPQETLKNTDLNDIIDINLKEKEEVK